MLEVFREVFEDKESLKDVIAIDCEILFDTKQIYYISVVSFDGSDIDFESIFLHLINRYPLYIKLQIDLVNYREFKLLLMELNIVFKETLKNTDFAWFEIEMNNDVHFDRIYEYLFASAVSNLTAIYSIEEDIFKSENTKAHNIVTNRLEMNKSFVAHFNGNNTVVGIGPDGVGIEIWTTDTELVHQNFYLEKLRDYFTLQEES